MYGIGNNHNQSRQMSVRGILWLTKYTSRTFVEGRTAGERWKSNESLFSGCRSSFVDKFRQRRAFGIEILGSVVHRVGR